MRKRLATLIRGSRLSRSTLKPKAQHLVKLANIARSSVNSESWTNTHLANIYARHWVTANSNLPNGLSIIVSLPSTQSPRTIRCSAALLARLGRHLPFISFPPFVALFHRMDVRCCAKCLELSGDEQRLDFSGMPLGGARLLCKDTSRVNVTAGESIERKVRSRQLISTECNIQTREQ